jgi:hypothetical protein
MALDKGLNSLSISLRERRRSLATLSEGAVNDVRRLQKKYERDKDKGSVLPYCKNLYVQYGGLM